MIERETGMEERERDRDGKDRQSGRSVREKGVREKETGMRERKIKRFRVGERKIGRETGVVREKEREGEKGKNL